MTTHLTDSLHFLDPTTIENQMTAIGVDRATRVIYHCGSGVTACHGILAAVEAGLERPDLYVGSWSEWSSTDLPIARGGTP